MDVDLVKRKYRRNAVLYDLVRAPTARLRTLAVERLNLRSGGVVLDFGCGTGLSFELLEAHVGPEGRIIGVDVSPDMLAKAHEKVTEHGWSNVTVVEADVEDVTLEPESLDAVLCFYTHDIMRSERALGAAVRALRTGGRFVAAGVKRVGGVRGLVLDPLTLAYSLPAVTSLDGLERPWTIAESLLGPLDIEERLAGTAYVARGVKLSIEDLARRTGEPADLLRHWRALGLISEPEAETLRPADAERVRLVRTFLDRGIALEAVTAWARAGELDGYMRLIAPGSNPAVYSLREAARRSGLDADLAVRIWETGDLGQVTDTLTNDDVAALTMIRKALDAGLPEEAISQLARVSTDALGRVAEAQARLFHFHVRRGLQSHGLSGPAYARAVQSASDKLVPLIEPIVTYCHRKALQAAMREAAVLELAEQSGALREPESLEQIDAAIVFVDLSSFTSLADAMGDRKGAEILDRFSSLVRQAAKQFGGRIVKQIGDAFMLAFPNPGAAVAFALEVESQAGFEPRFPAVRGGVSWGPVLYRDGDYVGTNVNLAARLAAEAERHQVLVSAAVRHNAAGLAGVEFTALRRCRLRGLSEEVELYEARSTEGTATAHVVDPVCGMELDPAAAAVTLRFEGQDLAFCSQECLRRFALAPDQYGFGSCGSPPSRAE